MKKNTQSIVLVITFLSIISLVTACKKHEVCLPAGNQLFKYEFYDVSGLLANKDEYSYTDSLITHIASSYGNSTTLTYNNQNQIVRVTYYLIGVPFPIAYRDIEYKTNGDLLKITTTGNDVNGNPSLTKTVTSFNWVANNLKNVEVKKYGTTGVLAEIESYNYTYSGNNIRKCFFYGDLYNINPTGPTITWVDSLEFEYDINPNYGRNGSKYSFFIDRFNSAALTSLVPIIDLPNSLPRSRYHYSALLYCFSLNENNIIKISTDGGINSSIINYSLRTGVLSSQQLAEIIVDGRIAAKYFYR